MDEKLQRITEVNPELWETLIKQVKVDVYTGCFWLLFYAGVLIFFIILSQYIRNSGEGDEDDFNKGCANLILIGSFFLVVPISVWYISILIKYLVNPEYYALRLFLGN